MHDEIAELNLKSVDRETKSLYQRQIN